MRRQGGAQRHSPSAGVQDLIHQLELGSAAAGDRLLAALLPLSDRRSSEHGDRTLADVDGRGDDAADLLDRLAEAAAAGSSRCLELLLTAVVEHRLAAPAIHRLSNNPVVVEEAEQEVLVAITRSIGGFRGDARFTTWLYSLARNTTIGHLRRLQPSSELVTDDLLDDRRPRRMSSQVAQREVVHQAIQSLPPVLRQTVVLRDIEGLSYQEIAHRQGLELNTVRSRLSRGRALLAARLS